MEPKEKQETQNEPSSKPKEQPNFVPTGKAQREHAVYRGIELKWDEPPDMHLPTSRWRAYVFRKDDPDNPLSLFNVGIMTPFSLYSSLLSSSRSWIHVWAR